MAEGSTATRLFRIKSLRKKSSCSCIFARSSHGSSSSASSLTTKAFCAKSTVDGIALFCTVSTGTSVITRSSKRNVCASISSLVYTPARRSISGCLAIAARSFSMPDGVGATSSSKTARSEAPARRAITTRSFRASPKPSLATSHPAGKGALAPRMSQATTMLKPARDARVVASIARR